MRRRDKTRNIEELNKRLLGEGVSKVIKEDHEHSDEGKIEYIKGALGNLSSENLDKIYKMVEELDPEYKKEKTYNWHHPIGLGS